MGGRVISGTAAELDPTGVAGAEAVVRAIALGVELYGAGAEAVPPPPLDPTSEPTAAAQQLDRVVDLANAERARAGLAPVAEDPRLTRAAQDYADLMADTSCFGHHCGPLAGMVERVQAAGVGGDGEQWHYLGENLAAGQTSPEEVVAAWMASPGHRDVLLDPHYAVLGVGLARGGTYGYYWTLSMGVAYPPAA